jgi:hypothetical protein
MFPINYFCFKETYYQMLSCPYILMIGGNARHTGKTSMVCSVISKFSAQLEIIGLKVTGIKPGEDKFHGNHKGEAAEPYTILEEINQHSEKDTSQMIRAGATRVFYIRAQDDFMEAAILRFLEIIGNRPIVCESRSLRTLVEPGLFLLMMRDLPGEQPKNMSQYLAIADDICSSGNDNEAIQSLTSRISFNENGWKLLAAIRECGK